MRKTSRSNLQQAFGIVFFLLFSVASLFAGLYSSDPRLIYRVFGVAFAWPILLIDYVSEVFRIPENSILIGVSLLVYVILYGVLGVFVGFKIAKLIERVRVASEN